MVVSHNSRLRERGCEMKTKAQIEAQIKKLRKLAQAPGPQTDVSKTAYEAWHTLRWVLESGLDWTPTSNCKAWGTHVDYFER